MEQASQSRVQTRALYNSDCPVCNAEMCTYNAYSQAQDLAIAFDDLNQIDMEKWGVTEDEATRLLHVIHNDKLYIGFEAMVILWEQMPRYRWMARIARVPGLYQILDWSYVHIVARIIYNRHVRRKAKGLVRR